MPTYNSEKTLEQSVKSVFEQSYQNWELLISDDCSSDSTREIISKFQQCDSRVIGIYNETNQGAGKSRNVAISRASGKYIAFLDSDDLWLPEKLSKQIGYMEKHKVDFTYTAYQKISSEKGLTGVVKPPRKTNYKKLLYSNVIGCLTAVYNAESLGKKYMPLIRKRQDMALWLDILKTVDTAHCIPEVLALYREGNGMSGNKVKILKWQWMLYRDVLKLGRIRSARYFAVYVVKGSLKFIK